MRRCLFSCSMVFLLATPAMATPWVRGYVITNFEPAWHFGGSTSFHKAGVLQPGSDCPGGSFLDIDYKTVLQTPWRDARAVKKLLNPPRTDPGTELVLQERLLTYRGFRDGVDIYINPFSAPDPGMQEVTGKIAEGFDLDHNPNTGGFTSPDGEKGIDNAFYRSLGCLSTFRDFPYHAILSRRSDDEMAVEGLFTFVIRVSGNRDPMNDDNAEVEIGFSPDQLVMGGDGNMLADYSFRLVRNGEYSKVKATVKNGTVETEQVDELHSPRPAAFANQFGDADFHKGLMRLAIDANGDISGLIGGYRDWRQIFAEHYFNASGGHEEQRDHEDAIGMYYALKRNADGMPSPETGKYTGISIAYRFKARPAFVVDSATLERTTIAMTDTIARSFQQMNAHRDALFKALASREIQPLPAGSKEGAYNRSFPQQQPDGSWKLVPTQRGGADNSPTLPNYGDEAASPKPKQQQVYNSANGIIASIEER